MRFVFFQVVVLVLLLVGCGGGTSPEGHIEKGRNYSSNEEWSSAIIEYKNAIRLAPKRFEPRIELGKVYMESGQFLSALKEFNRAVELGADRNSLIIPLSKAYLQTAQFQEIISLIEPENADNNSESAEMYAYLGLAKAHLKQPAALESLQKAKKLDVDHRSVRLAWAKFESLQGNSEKSKEWLAPLLKHGKGDPDAWSQLGNMEFESKNFDSAINAFSHSIEQRKYVHQDLMLRSMAYLNTGKLDKAQADIDTLMASNQSWIGIPHIAGMIALQEEDLEKARGLFQKVLSTNPDYAPSQFFLASIEIRENNLQNALSLLEQYVDRIPTDLHANLLYSDVLIKLDKLEKAQSELKRLYKSNKDNPQVLVLFGRSYLKQNSIDQAVDFFRQSININPDDIEARVLLGNALLSQSKTRALGRKELENALKLNSRLLPAYESLFKSYLDEKNFELAGQTAERVKKEFKDESVGSNMEALSALLQGDKVRAEEILKSSLKKFPEDPRTSKNLASMYMQAGEYESAKSLFEKQVLRDRSDVRVYGQLALIAAKQGEKEKALNWLKQSVENNPGKLSPKLMLAAEYLVRGLPKQADLLLAPEEERSRVNPLFLLTFAQTKLALNDTQKAQRILSVLVDEVPNSTAAHLLLAKVHAKNKDQVSLRASLKKVLDLEQDNLAAQLAMARLELYERNDRAFNNWMKILTSKFPSNPYVMWLQAKRDSGDKNYKEAVGVLSDLFEQIPISGVVKELAFNHWRKGDKESAITVLEVWRKDNPEDVSILTDLAQYYAVENREDESRKIYTILNQISPNDSTVLNNLAWLMRDVDIKQALEYSKKALSINPDDPSAMDTLAVLYLNDNQFENALLYAKSAFQALPSSESIQLTYAKSLIANNDTKLGQRILSRLMEKTESNSIRQQAKAELDRLK
jgi:putative PEP-CTERM system TPR-repeat lipoprotein